MATVETVYIDRNNTIDLLLKADGAAQDLSPVTRMVLSDRAGIFTIDSDQVAGAFDWNTGTTGKVIMALGDQGLAAGTYICNLILYDPTNSDGINWGRLVIKVEA